MTLCFSHTSSDVTYSKQVTKPESHITSGKNKTKWPRHVRKLILDFDQWIQIICFNKRWYCMGTKGVKGGQSGRLGDQGRQVRRRGPEGGRLGCVKVLGCQIGSHGVKRDVMGFQRGVHGVPLGQGERQWGLMGSRGMSRGH